VKLTGNLREAILAILAEIMAEYIIDIYLCLRDISQGDKHMVRKVVESVPDDVLQQDLTRYRQRAIELGATDAKIITTDMIIIDARVRMKCMVPVCRSYGTNPHCPPHAMDLDLVRETVNNFKYAIFYMLKLPSAEVAGPEAKEKRLSIASQITNWEIATKLESEAFYDGYYLAMAFAGGPCNIVYCSDRRCTVLAAQRACPNALFVRPSMEGGGMDVYLMATRVGWDIYPIGGGISPSQVPFGAKLGLVLIY